MTAPAAPLEKAVEEARKALADYDGCKGYEADEYAMCCIEPFRLLLAALDADKSAERAEAALRERLPVINEWKRLCADFETAKAERDVAVSVLREIATFGYYAKGAKVARRYFAEKGER